MRTLKALLLGVLLAAAAWLFTIAVVGCGEAPAETLDPGRIVLLQEKTVSSEQPDVYVYQVESNHVAVFRTSSGVTAVLLPSKE